MAANFRHDRAAILSIGDELMDGRVPDNNAPWLAQALADRGVRTIERCTVPDDFDAVAGAFERLSRAAPLVISTGGLGPTGDDFTRQALAAAMGEALVEDEQALEALRRRYGELGEGVIEANRIQAARPASATLVRNPRGTAPGLRARLERDDAAADVFCLPGPPNEMQPMFAEEVAPALRPPETGVTRVRTLHIFGVPESALPEKLGDLLARDRNPVVGTSAAVAMVSLRIRFVGEASQAEDAIARTESAIRERLDPYVYGVDDDTLHGAVLRLLEERGETLVTAESCTGGLASEWITSVPGSSKVFVGGWATYTNEMKAAALGVPRETLTQYGAVSEPTARAMAEGALAASERAGVPADHAISITGIAGPEGGSAEKPVGTVYIGLARRGGDTEVRHFHFMGDRAMVRTRSGLAALAMLRFHLIGVGDLPLLWEVRDGARRRVN